MLLDVRDLHVGYPGGARAVRGVDLAIGAGARVGLVGESGCGKTTLARALVGLLPVGSTVTGSVRLDGQELLGDDERALRAVRGRRLALVPQGAMGALNPVLRIDEQVGETMVAHTGRSWRQARREVGGLLEQVGLEASVARRYPHELSGGMCQRVVIATAVAAEPDIVVADEPTTGLDVLVQAQVLATLQKLQRDRGFALLLISHDVRTVLSICDRVVVMYAGRVAEDSPSAILADAPRHPYSFGLLRSLPPLVGDLHDDQGWASIPGSAPEATDPVAGCAFAPRCSHRMTACEVDPSPQVIAGATAGTGSTRVACHLHDDGDVGRVEAEVLVLRRRRRGIGPGGEPLLQIRDLHVTYQARRRRQNPVRAVRGVWLEIAAGQILGLIGKSGSGKTTIGRVLMGLAQAQQGSVRLAGTEVVGANQATLRDHRSRVAMVRQDPFDALHPAMTIRDIVAEPLVIAGRRDVDESVAEALSRARLEPTSTLLVRRPGELSGGQRQRVALARALIGAPLLLVADEPTSMLDTSVRAGIAQTLLSLRDELGLAVLFITHDLAEAAHVCDELVVLLDGQVVEHGAADDIIERPLHDYTRALLAAATGSATDSTDPTHPPTVGDQSLEHTT